MVQVYAAWSCMIDALLQDDLPVLLRIVPSTYQLIQDWSLQIRTPASRSFFFCLRRGEARPFSNVQRAW